MCHLNYKVNYVDIFRIFMRGLEIVLRKHKYLQKSIYEGDHNDLIKVNSPNVILVISHKLNNMALKYACFVIPGAFQQSWYEETHCRVRENPALPVSSGRFSARLFPNAPSVRHWSVLLKYSF